MTVWIVNDMNLTAPLNFQDEAKDVVILGKITSDSDVSFKVKNLVIFGEILTSKNITLNTTVDLFNVGKVKGDEVNVKGQNIVYGVDDGVIERIRALGIDLYRRPDGGLSIRPPAQV